VAYEVAPDVQNARGGDPVRRRQREAS